MGHLHQGRPKGSKNRISEKLKMDVFDCYLDLGGMKGMLEWVQSSPEAMDKFYSGILAKLLPKEASIDIDIDVSKQLDISMKVLSVLTDEQLEALSQQNLTIEHGPEAEIIDESDTNNA